MTIFSKKRLLLGKMVRFKDARLYDTAAGHIYGRLDIYILILKRVGVYVAASTTYRRAICNTALEHTHWDGVSALSLS